MAYDIEETLDIEGHDVVKVSYPISSYIADKGFNDYIVRILDKDNFDCIFTMNYIPALAKISFLRKIKYIAWISDSPNYTTYSEMIHSPYNYIFHFDKKEVENLRSTGAKNIFHMPLAVNTKRVTKQIETSKIQKNKYKADVSFLGSLYSDRDFFDKISGINDYQKGFVDAVIKAQLLFQGCDLIEEALPKSFIESVLKLVDFNMDSEIKLSDEKILLDLIRKKATSIERIELLNFIAKKYQVVLYTGSADNMLYHVENRGYLDYNTQMPVMFNSSRINLNITLRSIQSGISLRALDIMGAGGFLISNWQPELAECFEEGKEVVMYYDRNDLMSKIEYYLQNEDERMKIAENGQKKIIEQFDYSCAWKKIFGVVF